jgi:hypothetical protein
VKGTMICVKGTMFIAQINFFFSSKVLKFHNRKLLFLPNDGVFRNNTLSFYYITLIVNL